MNIFKRTAARMAWRHMEGKLPEKLKRWVPVASSVVLGLSVVLRLLGYTDIADSIAGVLNATGLTQQSALSVAEFLVVATSVTAATGALGGAGLKIKSQIKKAQEAKVTVGPR